jgi:hypothetical protein
VHRAKEAGQEICNSKYRAALTAIEVETQSLQDIHSRISGVSRESAIYPIIRIEAEIEDMPGVEQ